VIKIINSDKAKILESQVGKRGSLTITGANRGKVRSWIMNMSGIPYEVLIRLGHAELRDIYNDVTDVKLQEMTKRCEAKAEGTPATASEKAIAAFMAALPTAYDEDKIISLVEQIVDEKMIPPAIIINKRKDLPPVDLGVQHYKFSLALAAAKAGLNIALVGPAGSGKSTTAEAIAKALGVPFELQSFCRQTTESKLLGFIDAGGTYRTSPLRRAYEFGGLYCADEFDAGNENVNVVINAALSGGVCSFPDGMVKRHPDFIVITCMNTYGFGGSRVYVGRNQLDGASTDRFVFIDWPIDKSLEASFAGVRVEPDDFNIKRGGSLTQEEWLARVFALRDAAVAAEVRHVISPRATIFGNQLFGEGVGKSHVEEMVIWKGLDLEQRKRIEAKLKEINKAEAGK
jgi:cobaltochelatase CobS